MHSYVENATEPDESRPVFPPPPPRRDKEVSVTLKGYSRIDIRRCKARICVSAEIKRGEFKAKRPRRIILPLRRYYGVLSENEIREKLRYFIYMYTISTKQFDCYIYGIRMREKYRSIHAYTDISTSYIE